MQFLSMQEFLNQYEKTDPFSLQQDIINAYRKERKPQSLKRLPSEKDWRRYDKICPKYYWWETKKVFDEESLKDFLKFEEELEKPNFLP